MVKTFCEFQHIFKALAITMVMVGCQQKEIPSEVTYHSLVPHQTIVSGENLELVNPAIIRFNNETNEFYIYDNRQRIAHRVNTNGNFLGNVGRQGKGPGEYERISGIFIGIDCIYLVDDIQFLVHKYALNGEYVDSFNYGPYSTASVNKVSVGRDGHIYLPVDNSHEHLFRKFAWSGEEIGSFGDFFAGSSNQIDYAELRSAIKDRKVPSFFKSNAFVIPGSLQNIIVYDAVGSLRSYSGTEIKWQSSGASSSIQDSISKPYYEFMDQILQHADAAAALRIYHQGTITNEFVYLSTNTSFGQEMQLHAFDMYGNLHAIYVFETESSLNSSFDVNEESGLIYVGTTNAEVIAFKLDGRL
jgi:hypothetical protein